MTHPDPAALLFGRNAVHVPAWLYVQDGGGRDGCPVVSFVGCSTGQAIGQPHPMRYGSTATHQLVLGELVLRPHRIYASDAARGDGLASLVTGSRHDDFLDSGAVLLQSPGGTVRPEGWSR